MVSYRVHSQRGTSIIEAIAYLAVYGSITVAVLGGVSAILTAVREKIDIAAIIHLEKDIRSAGSVLDDYDVTKTPDSIDGGKTTLKLYLNEKAKVKNTNKLPSGKDVDFASSGVVTVATGCNVAYSFAVIAKSLSLTECADYWNYSWPKSVVLIETKNSGNASVYNINSSCDYELPDPDFCESGKDFTLYFK